METPGYKSWRATLLTLSLIGLTVGLFLHAGSVQAPALPIPVLSGLLLFFIGALFSYFLPLGSARYPLLVVFSLLGNFLIIHAAGSLPSPWGVAALGAFAVLYLLWIFRLVLLVRRPQLDFERLLAKHVLYLQLGGFLLPVLIAVGVTLILPGRPWNLLSVFLVLFPISYFIGFILGRLRQSQTQVFQTKKRAALGNLLAGLAHEIKNPVTFIYSNIDPLRDMVVHFKKALPNPDPKTAALLEDFGLLVDNLEEGAERVKGMVDNFRYFSYPGRAKREAVDVNAVLDRSIELLRPKWKDRIEIRRTYSELPAVQADPGEIGQVFVNILDNACDGIDGKGSIDVSTRRSDGLVEIRVKDSGAGIPKQILSKIFDPLYTSKPQGQGTGLGLAISIQIIEDHQGRIEVSSEPGLGTEARVLLPVGSSQDRKR